jgi:hypothetical protein
MAPGAAAQVFEVRGGSSSLTEAHGGSLILYGGNYTTRFSLGYTDKMRYGFLVSTRFWGSTWGFGDQPIPFLLPTDQFIGAYSFYGRGASALRKDARSSLFVFAGVTSTTFSSPFVNFAKPDQGAGLIFYEREFASRWRFTSRNIFSEKQTSIHSLEWKPARDALLAFSAGVGSNQPYWSSSLNFKRERIVVVASYTHAGSGFRRITVDTPVLAETDRENFRVDWKPRPKLGFYLTRNNYLNPAPQPGVDLRSTVNGVGYWTSPAGFHLYGSLFHSQTRSGEGVSIIAGGRRKLTHWLETGADYLRSRPAVGATTQNVIATVRETVTPRLSLVQVITVGGGQRSVSFGGNFISNLVTLGAEYQTVYLPFAAPGQSNLRQVLVLSLRLQLPRNLAIEVDTNITPSGEVRYTGYFDTFAYRGFGPNAANRLPSGAFHPKVVQGRVVDDKGEPVAGAALRIGEEIVFTNPQGRFFLRVKKAQEMPLVVLLEEFMLPGRYEVVSAPAAVRPGREESAQMYEVVLRRLASQPTKKILPAGRQRWPLPPEDLFPLGTPERIDLVRSIPFYHSCRCNFFG